jgi:hypothetical protein
MTVGETRFFVPLSLGFGAERIGVRSSSGTVTVLICFGHAAPAKVKAGQLAEGHIYRSLGQRPRKSKP